MAGSTPSRPGNSPGGKGGAGGGAPDSNAGASSSQVPSGGPPPTPVPGFEPGERPPVPGADLGGAASAGEDVAGATGQAASAAGDASSAGRQAASSASDAASAAKEAASAAGEASNAAKQAAGAASGGVTKYKDDAVKVTKAASRGDALGAGDAAVVAGGAGAADYFAPGSGSAVRAFANTGVGRKTTRAFTWVGVIGALSSLAVPLLLTLAVLAGLSTVVAGGAAMAECEPVSGAAASLENPTQDEVAGTIYSQAMGLGFGEVGAMIAIGVGLGESGLQNDTVGDMWSDGHGRTSSRGVFQQMQFWAPAGMAWSGQPSPDANADFSAFNDTNAWGPNGWAVTDPRMNVPQSASIFFIGLGQNSGNEGLEGNSQFASVRNSDPMSISSGQMVQIAQQVQGFPVAHMGSYEANMTGAREYFQRIKSGEIPVPPFQKPLQQVAAKAFQPWLVEEIASLGPLPTAIGSAAASSSSQGPDEEAPASGRSQRENTKPDRTSGPDAPRTSEEGIQGEPAADAKPRPSSERNAGTRAANNGAGARGAKATESSAQARQSQATTASGEVRFSAKSTRSAEDSSSNDAPSPDSTAAAPGKIPGITFIGDSVMVGMLDANNPPATLFGGPAIRHAVQSITLQQVLNNSSFANENLAAWRKDISTGPSIILVELGTNGSSNPAAEIDQFMQLAGPERQVYWFAQHYVKAKPFQSALEAAAGKHLNLRIVPVLDLMPDGAYRPATQEGAHPSFAYVDMWNRAMEMIAVGGAGPFEAYDNCPGDSSGAGGYSQVPPGSSMDYLPSEDPVLPKAGFTVNTPGGNNMVYYNQSDRRWTAAEPSYDFPWCGCGQNSIAMVIATLAREPNYTPVEAYREHKVTGSGISGNCGTANGAQDFPTMARNHGFDGRFLGADSAAWNEARSILDRGGLVIASLTGLADTTWGAHLIVVRGYTSDGKFLVADPAGGSGPRLTLSAGFSPSQFRFNNGLIGFLPAGQKV